MKKKRSILLALSVFTLFGFNSSFVKASDIKWPTKTVEVVVTANAGGDTDFNARTFAKYFKKYAGKSMVITNTAGSNGMIAINQIKNAAPNGYKVLFCHTGQMIVNEVSGNNKGENYLEALEISAIPAIDKGTILVANPKSNIKTVVEMVEKAKSAPATLIYGTELGGYSHLQGLMLQEKSGAKLKFVDVGSTSDKITSLLGNRIDVAAITYGSVADYLKTGELVALAQFNEKRNEHLDSNIPTFKEAGLDFAMEKPYIISFPKGTDKKIIDKMQEIVKKVIEDEKYAKDLYDSYKQPVEFLLREDAKVRLNETREEFLQYKNLLKK